MYFQDKAQEIDLNPRLAIEKLDSWLDGFVKLLPNIGIAIIVVIISYFLARLAKVLVRKATNRNGRENLGTLLGGLVKWIVFIFGVVLALTIVIPSLKPGDIIAGLGVSSVAIGFAFKDILQNWLAGLLILLRQPFEIGDQIVVEGIEGTVLRIETRATIIRQYNGIRAVVPNSEIYTNAIKVNTANETIRSQYDVGIGYADDIKDAEAVLKKALLSIDEIDKEKGVDVLPWDLAASWVTIRLRWWTDPERATVIKTTANVIRTIKYALDEAGIDMPYNTEVKLHHDQTESTDGDRAAQREGWPDDGDKNRKPARREQNDSESHKKPSVAKVEKDKQGKENESQE